MKSRSGLCITSTCAPVGTGKMHPASRGSGQPQVQSQRHRGKKIHHAAKDKSIRRPGRVQKSHTDRPKRTVGRQVPASLAPYSPEPGFLLYAPLVSGQGWPEGGHQQAGSLRSPLTTAQIPHFENLARPGLRPVDPGQNTRRPVSLQKPMAAFWHSSCFVPCLSTFCPYAILALCLDRIWTVNHRLASGLLAFPAGRCASFRSALI